MELTTQSINKNVYKFKSRDNSCNMRLFVVIEKKTKRLFTIQNNLIGCQWKIQYLSQYNLTRDELEFNVLIKN